MIKSNQSNGTKSNQNNPADNDLVTHYLFKSTYLAFFSKFNAHIFSTHTHCEIPSPCVPSEGMLVCQLYSKRVKAV